MSAPKRKWAQWAGRFQKTGAGRGGLCWEAVAGRGCPSLGESLREPGFGVILPWLGPTGPRAAGSDMKVQGQANVGGLAERGEALHTLSISKASSHWGGAFTWEGASLCPGEEPAFVQPLQPPLTHQVPAACADPRSDTVGAHAPRGAPGGVGALAHRVLRDGAGPDQVGWAAVEGGGGTRPALLCSGLAVPAPSCLQPLQFCCDYRPYFTIHDSEFKEFTTRTQAP